MPALPKFEVAAGAIDNVNTATQRCARCRVVQTLDAFGEAKYRSSGKNIYCRPCAARKARAWKVENKNKVREAEAQKRLEWGGVRFEKPITRATAANRLIRLEVLAKLGGVCTCCGEDREEFLTVDHVRGGGGKHRAEVGTYIYRRLRRDPDPVEYRILCYNCNCARGARGYCPHEREQEREVS